MKKLLLFYVFFNCVNFLHSQNQLLPELRTEGFDRSANLQNSSIRDSIVSKFGVSTSLNKNPDAKIEDYLIISRESDTTVVDTSLTINKYYKLNYLRKDDFDKIPFSNTGTAYNTLSFSNFNSITPKMGASTKYLSYDSVDDIDYYYLPTPFTELMYRSVFEQGQLLDAIYSVNTSRQFNFSISRKGLRSLGNYQNFLSSSSNFNFTTNYISKNKNYKFRTHFANQRLFSEQNGGINDSDILNFENGNSQFLDRGVFDPNFQNAHNEFLGKRFYIDQKYVIVKKDSIKGGIELFNSVYHEEKKYKFQQSSSDEFFGGSYASQEINDKILLNTINLNAGLIYTSEKLGKINLGFKYIADIYSTDNFQIEELIIDDTKTINTKTTFLTVKYLKIFSNIELNVKTENFIIGDNKSNMFDSKFKLKLKNDSSLELNYKFLSMVPNYNFLLYTSNYENYNWYNQFENPVSNSISFKLYLNKLLDLNAEFISVNNHIQFEKSISENLLDLTGYSILPVQHNRTLEILKIQLARKINFGKFSIDSKILLQKSMSDEIINLPKFVSRNTVYFSTDMFKKALFLQTGFGIKYFSKFYMNGYDPFLSELYIQNEKEIGGFPLIDFFINAKIQQTRLYFKFEHLNSSFTGYNYYSAPNYPYRDFTFRFGLVWNFFM